MTPISQLPSAEFDAKVAEVMARLDRNSIEPFFADAHAIIERQRAELASLRAEREWRPIADLLREYACGTQRIPHELRRVPFVALDAIADWLIALPTPPEPRPQQEK